MNYFFFSGIQEDIKNSVFNKKNFKFNETFIKESQRKGNEISFYIYPIKINKNTSSVDKIIGGKVWTLKLCSI